jgi:DNA-binding Lrp family transcriptional regulator
MKRPKEDLIIINNMAKKKKEKLKFPGLPSNYLKDFFKYPKALGLYWYILSGSEQKVLDFILRQTIGFQKDSDEIGLSQFLNGIRKISNGTGLSKGGILNAINGLEDKGFIKVKKTDYKTNEYGLIVQNLNESSPKFGKNNSILGPLTGLKLEHTIKTINKDSTKEEINKIFLLYNEKICSGARLTSKGERLIAERLKEYSLADIEKAIENFSNDTWYMEKHAFRGVEWFFKTEGQIDTFLNLPPSSENKKEILHLRS